MSVFFLKIGSYQKAHVRIESSFTPPSQLSYECEGLIRGETNGHCKYVRLWAQRVPSRTPVKPPNKDTICQYVTASMSISRSRELLYTTGKTQSKQVIQGETHGQCQSQWSVSRSRDFL